MSNVLIQLKENLKGSFSPQNLKELENIEDTLVFSSFNSSDALALGGLLVQNAKKYGEDIAAVIIREEDQATVFQYIGENCGTRNVEFALKKRNAVLKTGHCSLYAMAAAVVEKKYPELFEPQNDCLPSGGSYPVYFDNKLSYTISVSGLHHGNDQLLLTETLGAYLNKEVPEYSGGLI